MLNKLAGKFLDDFKVNNTANGKCDKDTFVELNHRHCRDIEPLNN